MPKALQFIVALWLSGSSFVNAAENSLNLSKIAFDTSGMSPKIILTVANVSGQSVEAWRGQLVCLDAFGDQVIDVFVISRSANIEPYQSYDVERRLSAQIGDEDRQKVAQAALIVLENKAENFECELKDLEVVYK